MGASTKFRHALCSIASENDRLELAHPRLGLVVVGSEHERGEGWRQVSQQKCRNSRSNCRSLGPIADRRVDLPTTSASRNTGL